MFFINPTIEELQNLDLSILLDMLASQTEMHTQMLKEGHITGERNSCSELILNIQAAIAVKRRLSENTVSKNGSERNQSSEKKYSKSPSKDGD